MPEFECQDCGVKLFHENETTLELEKKVHQKFCSKDPNDTKSYMHREPDDPEPYDEKRAKDQSGNPVLKK